MDKQHFSYGGQAVIEGVMMRGRQQATVAVRQPGGSLAYQHFPLDAVSRARWERIPLLRGVVLLWDMLNLGIRALNFSASAAAGEDELPRSTTTGALITALLFAIGLFFVLPLLIASLAVHLGTPTLLHDLIEGVARLGIIVGYIAAISLLPDIQRVFAYHGAEHKTVNAYEAGRPLTPSHVQQESRIHPRCGTSFLVVVVLISFLVFAMLGDMPFWAKVLSRMLLVPIIAAIAYEVLRLSAAHSHHPWVRWLLTPTLALQHLTTREPDDPMIATAIAALTHVLAADGIAQPDPACSDDSLLAASV